MSGSVKVSRNLVDFTPPRMRSSDVDDPLLQAVIQRVQALADISRLALHAIIIGRFDYSQTVSRESGKTRRGFGPKHYEYSSVPNGTVPLNSHVSACST